MSKKTLYILLLFLILGFSLRVFYLKDSVLTFGYDQSRDAYTALAILSGDLKIQGPAASFPGLFHGVLYYYLITPAYFLGQGDPRALFVWLAIINIGTIFPIFFLGKVLHSEKLGILAAALFTISFDAIQYSNWLSNPAPAVLTSAIFYLSLALIIFKKPTKMVFFLLALSLGLSVQFEIFLIYLFIPLLFTLAIFKVKPSLNQILVFTVTFMVTISSMILSYIKFGFNFLQVLGSSSIYQSQRSLLQYVEVYLKQFSDNFYRNLIPLNQTTGEVFGIIILAFLIWGFLVKKSTLSKPIIFLLIMLFSHTILIPFGGQTTPYTNVGLQTILLTLGAFFIIELSKIQKILGFFIMALVIYANLYAFVTLGFRGPVVFDVQENLTLRDQLKAIDYTYKSAAGQDFSFNSTTSPLWINTVWDYLYFWYGNKTYHYLPTFHGRDQIGQLGKLQKITHKEKVYFLIKEPPRGIVQKYIDDTIAYEDAISILVEEKHFGTIVVQKRIPKPQT